MKFRIRHRHDDPEINLIPFIDVLLVVLIFLMMSTTYSRFTELQVNLPTADADKPRERPQEIVVSIAADGRYAINKRPVESRSVDRLTVELAAEAQQIKDAVIVVSADAGAAHQSVINVMDAARRAGLSRLTFAAQLGQPGEAPR
jgi:biopolymer transport protein ExbD